MRKYSLKIIFLVNTAILIPVLLESLFLFKGPIFQFVEYYSADNNIPNPFQFYVKIILGFSLFSIYGFLNRDKYDILYPDMWKNWLLLLSLVCTVFYCINQFTHIETLKDMFREDHFFENMTFVLLFVSSMIFLRSFLIIKNKFSIYPKIFILLLAIFCFTVAMEEISWGQRILGWQSPEGWNELNYQNETNIHNISATYGIIRIFKICFTLFFSMMFGFSLFIRDHLKPYDLEFLIPNQKFFLFAFILPLTHSFHEINEIIISLIFIFYSYALFSGARKFKDISKISVFP